MADTRLPHTVLVVEGDGKRTPGRTRDLIVDRAVNTIEQASELRRRAEDSALRHAAPASVDLEFTLPPWAVDMVHELRVHQIELEMQNEELRLAQVKLDDSKAVTGHPSVLALSSSRRGRNSDLPGEFDRHS